MEFRIRFVDETGPIELGASSLVAARKIVAFLERAKAEGVEVLAASGETIDVGRDAIDGE